MTLEARPHAKRLPKYAAIVEVRTVEIDGRNSARRCCFSAARSASCEVVGAMVSRWEVMAGAPGREEVLCSGWSAGARAMRGTAIS